MQQLPIDHQPSLREKRRQVLLGIAQALAGAYRRAALKLPRGSRLAACPAQPGAHGSTRRAQRVAPAASQLADQDLGLSKIRIIGVGGEAAGGGTVVAAASAATAARRFARMGRAALHLRRVDMNQVPDDYRELMDATWGKAPTSDGQPHLQPRQGEADADGMAAAAAAALFGGPQAVAAAALYGHAPLEGQQQQQQLWPAGATSATGGQHKGAATFMAGLTSIETWQTATVSGAAFDSIVVSSAGAVGDGAMAMALDDATGAGHGSGLMGLLFDGQDGGGGGSAEAADAGVEEIEWE